MSVAAVEFGGVVSLARRVELGHGAFGEVGAIGYSPFVVHVREHGANESDHGGFVREDSHDTGRRLISLLTRSSGFVDQIFCRIVVASLTMIPVVLMLGSSPLYG